jgi:CopG family nickel-responsive transcriptional regulator
MSSDLVRLSFSIGSDLYESLELMVKKHGYENRSEFIRDMLREKLVESERVKNQKMIGTITIVYDHEQRELGRRLTKIQHQHHHEVVAATHIHLDEFMCAEAIIVKGESEKIEAILHELKREKGVVHASLSVGPLSKTRL